MHRNCFLIITEKSFREAQEVFSRENSNYEPGKPPKISGEDARMLHEELRALDRFRASSWERGAHRVVR